MSVKRKSADVGISHLMSKRTCLELDDVNQHPKNISKVDLEGRSSGAICPTIMEYKSHYPSSFISVMYKHHLSALCILRSLQYKYKYPSVSVSCEDSEIDQFRDIVIRYQTKSIHIQVVDNHYMDSDIGYSELFSKSQGFSLNAYFNSYVKYHVCRSFKFLRNIEFLVIYTNLGFDLTKDQDLSHSRRSRFYPFKLKTVDGAELGLLGEFLKSKISERIPHYRQFQLDKTTRKELFERLRLSSTMQKAVEQKKLSPTSIDKIKDEFFSKLVFAVNQPCREDLKTTIKSEIGNTCYSFTRLQEEVLKVSFSQSAFLYDLNLLILALNDMLLQKRINFSYENDGSTSLVTVYYRGKSTCIKPLLENRKINYNMLFPTKRLRAKSQMSLNTQFANFIEELAKNKNMKFYIIYTTARLELIDSKILKGSNPTNCPHFKLIDIRGRRFKILRHLSCINKNSLYQVEPNDMNVFSSLLEYPHDLKVNDGRMTNEINAIRLITEAKEMFLHKLVFATNQPNGNELKSTIRNATHHSTGSYNYESLQEIILRWSESHKQESITTDVARLILNDMNGNITTHQQLQKKDIAPEIRFAKIVIGREGTTSFYSFLQYLVEGEGRIYLENFRRSGLRLTSLSGILGKTGLRAKVTLKRLHDLCYDQGRKESLYLQALRINNIKFATVSTFLHNTRYHAPDVFEDLLSLWFNCDGSKTHYLRSLEREKISLSSFSSMLNVSGSHVTKAFRDLFDLLFDKDGCKTKYLRVPQENGIILSFFSILNNAGNEPAKAYKKLYELLFDGSGNKTFYFETLKKHGITLSSFVYLLNGSVQVSSMFLDAFHLLFDERGNKSRYLKTMEEEGIEYVTFIRILRGAGSKMTRAFKELYNLWFDEQGNKTVYLKALIQNEVDLRTMASILNSSGTHAAQAFQDLFLLWIDENGNKSVYLETLQKNGINIATLGNMLKGSGLSAAESYKAVHQILFDSEGNKSKRLSRLEEAGISITNVARLLGTSKSHIVTAFNDLYDLWFDSQAVKTRYLNNIENCGLQLSNMFSIFCGSGTYVAKAYKELCDCWFDENDNHTVYLQVFEHNGLNLIALSNILRQGGRYSAQIFIDLYNLWFDERGQKSICIRYLEREGIDLLSLAIAMRKSGSNAIKCFRNFYKFCYDENGNATHCFNVFKRNMISLQNVMEVFTRLTPNTGEIMEDLYYTFFTNQGDKTQYSIVLESNGVKLNEVVSILKGTNGAAVTIFLELYNLWFDDLGERKQCLTVLQRNGISLPDAIKILAGSGRRSLSKFTNMI